jgi:hypothetical protein
MGDGNGHVGFFGLLLNEAPFDTEIVVGKCAILAFIGNQVMLMAE